MVDLSIDAIQILQITEPNQAFHRLHILNQMKQYATYAGKLFDVEHIQSLVDDLVLKGYLEFLEKLESYRITPAGIDAMESI
ncbi:MAG: hypothetical protein ACXAC7_11715 [Candidatus Hodarchaeales archaeon]|jgi:hypothetical protein